MVLNVKFGALNCTKIALEEVHKLYEHLSLFAYGEISVRAVIINKRRNLTPISVPTKTPVVFEGGPRYLALARLSIQSTFHGFTVFIYPLSHRYSFSILILSFVT